MIVQLQNNEMKSTLVARQCERAFCVLYIYIQWRYCFERVIKGMDGHGECRKLHNLLLNKEVLQVGHLPNTCTNEDCDLDDRPLGGAVVDALGCVSE